MVSIEPLLPEHYERVASWLRRPDVNAWLGSPWRGRAVDSAMVSIAAHSPRNVMFLVRNADMPVGIACLADIDPGDLTGMVWYALGEPEARGRGIMPQAAALLCDYAFGTLKLRSLHAWILEPNSASRRVLEKIGFVQAGQIRRASIFEGHPVDRVLFDRIAPAMPAAREGAALSPSAAPVLPVLRKVQ